MEIRILNCNSIDRAVINIIPGTLNIKFGINGTGKSTISTAIELKCLNEDRLNELTPFKYLENNPDNIFPVVEGVDEINSVSIFNESYINQFVFQQDELIKNSFEIFIKNDEYNRKIDEIENLVSDIKLTFDSDENIERVISDLTELSSCFGKSKGGYSAAGPIGKGLGKGNKIENIPSGLESYSEFLRSEKNTQWIKWQVSGNEFLELSENCPWLLMDSKDRWK